MGVVHNIPALLLFVPNASFDRVRGKIGLLELKLVFLFLLGVAIIVVQILLRPLTRVLDLPVLFIGALFLRVYNDSSLLFAGVMD